MKISEGHPYHLHIGRTPPPPPMFCLANDHCKASKLFLFILVNRCSGSLFQNSQHQLLLIEMGLYLVSRITSIFDMIFSLDNFDVTFFASSLCKSFCVSSYYYYYYYLSVSDSVFHVILLLLYYLHFGSDSQSQEITGKPIKSIYTRKKSRMMFYEMSKVCIVLFQMMQNNNDVVTF